MRIKTISCLFALLTVLLSGCMYPDQQLTQNQVPYKDQIQSVQSAVDSFRKDNGGILPIASKDSNIPLYQRYPVDFKKLAPKYMAEPPGNAYENGGIFQYVLVNIETKPEVKLLDLRMTESIRDLKLRINAHGYPPYKKKLADNVYTIDYKQLGYQRPPFIESPFTNHNLSFVINGNADIYVDYSPDLNLALKKKNVKVKPGEDIRSILLNDSMFVPAYSLPYTLDAKTKEPIFLEQK
ncbi:MAG: hypothetical protein Q8934_04645 [Bacillota bacterium]|nr:hypothetical protein [Bacillota bacterium]